MLQCSMDFFFFYEATSQIAYDMPPLIFNTTQDLFQPHWKAALATAPIDSTLPKENKS